MTEQNDRERQIAECVLNFLEQPSAGYNLPRYQVLRAIAEQVINIQEYRLSTQEIAQKMGRNEDETKEIDRFFKDLVKDETFWSDLQGFAKEQGLSFCPYIAKKKGGGRGNPSYYFLVAKDLSEEESSLEEKIPAVKENVPVNQAANTDTIEYIRKSPTVGKWWIHKADDFVLKGWRFWFYFSPILISSSIFFFFVIVKMFPLIFLLIGSEIPHSSHVLINIKISILIILMAILCVFLPIYLFSIYSVLLKDIVEPWVFSSFFLNEPGVLLERVRTEEKRKSGRPIRKIRWSTYFGTCPICGDHVRTEGKRFPFGGTIVGKCMSNQRQHLFSFDHTTCIGKRITTD